MVSESGVIHFDVNDDNDPEMKLTHQGLGIGTIPSSNLSVAGNAIITNSLSVGGQGSSSNLWLQGVMSLGHLTVSSNTTIGLYHSMVLADTTASNITLEMASPALSKNRKITIKKVSTQNKLSLTSLSGIDLKNTVVIGSGESGCLSLMSDGLQWWIMSSTENTAMSQGNLILWSELESNSTTSFTDNGPYGYVGTGHDLNDSQLSQNGIFNKCVNFYGTKGYVSFGNPSALQSMKQVTCSVWVNNTVFNGSWDGIINYSDNDDFNRDVIFRFILTSGNPPRYKWTIGDNNQVTYGISSDNTAIANEWVHLAGTYDGSSLKFYINGVSQTDTSSPYVEMHTSSAANQMFVIGNKAMNAGSNNGGWYKFDGHIDSVRIYNKALDASQVNELYQLKQ